MTVKREIIDNWIYHHTPDGLAKLALKSEVSTSTIQKTRLGIIPVRTDIRKKLCRALKVQEGDLFPIIDEAS